MDNAILNLEQAGEFLGISVKTMIKLLREENIPARKIGREWRFSKTALTAWLSEGDSRNYIGRSEFYQASQDEAGKTSGLLQTIDRQLSQLRENNNIRQLVPLPKDVGLPESTTLRVSYKQQRDVEKLEFKLYWPMREESRGLGRSKTADEE